MIRTMFGWRNLKNTVNHTADNVGGKGEGRGWGIRAQQPGTGFGGPVAPGECCMLQQRVATVGQTFALVEHILVRGTIHQTNRSPTTKHPANKKRRNPVTSKRYLTVQDLCSKIKRTTTERGMRKSHGTQNMRKRAKRYERVPRTNANSRVPAPPYSTAPSFT